MAEIDDFAVADGGDGDEGHVQAVQPGHLRPADDLVADHADEVDADQGQRRAAKRW